MRQRAEVGEVKALVAGRVIVADHNHTIENHPYHENVHPHVAHDLQSPHTHGKSVNNDKERSKAAS